jgi:hypothetical protein
VIDAVAIIGTLHLRRDEIGRCKRVEKERKPVRRCEDVLEVKLAPVQPRGVAGKGAHGRVLMPRIANEPRIAGEVAAAGSQLVVKRPIPASFGAQLQREERDVAFGVGPVLRRQHEPLTADPFKPARDPDPGHEELRFGIGLVHGVPVAPEAEQSVAARDHVHMHGVDLLLGEHWANERIPGHGRSDGLAPIEGSDGLNYRIPAPTRIGAGAVEPSTGHIKPSRSGAGRTWNVVEYGRWRRLDHRLPGLALHSGTDGRTASPGVTSKSVSLGRRPHGQRNPRMR